MAPTGTKWRLLAWGRDESGDCYTKRFAAGPDVESTAEEGEVVANWPGAEFDELVVDGWLHVEGMDDHTYWMTVAGVRLVVEVGDDGRARSVLVEVEREDGVTYLGEVA